MNENISTAMADAIRVEMARQRVGIPWVATASRIPQRTLHSLLSGSTRDIKLHQVAAIARALGMHVGDLVARAERES